MNKVFDMLVKSNIEKMVDDFKRVSKEVFVNSDGKIISPLEYGTYRERIIGRLLKQYIPARYDVGTGFIITHKGSISTQCDLVIFDKENTPVLETDDQRFFPVECVAGVVEIKSKITKTDLKEALIKLSNIKKMRNEIGKANYVFNDKNDNSPFDITANFKDQLATFLICEKFDFDAASIINAFFKETYEDIDKSLYHNMILSLEDGCFMYNDGIRHIYYPYYSYGAKQHSNSLILPHSCGYKYEHVLLFINYFFMCISSVSILYVEVTNYLGPSRIKQSIIEKVVNDEK